MVKLKMSFYDQEMIGDHHSLSSGTSHRSTRRRLSSNAEIEDAQNAMVIDGNKRDRAPKVSSRSNANGQSHVSAITLTKLQLGRMNRKDELLSKIHERHEHLGQNAGQLVSSITQMMEQLAMKQSRHKQEIGTQEEAVRETLLRNKMMINIQEQQTEHLEEQQLALGNNRRGSRCFGGKTGAMFRNAMISIVVDYY